MDNVPSNGSPPQAPDFDPICGSFTKVAAYKVVAMRAPTLAARFELAHSATKPEAELRSFLPIIMGWAPPDSVWELREFYPNGGKASAIACVRDPQRAVELALRMIRRGRIPHLCLAPLKNAAFHRAADQIIEHAPVMAKDIDVTRRVVLAIDVDPEKDADGVSATESEHQAALAKAREIADWLAARGWPQPMTIDSGNGSWIIFRADLANDASTRELLKGFYVALAARFDDDSATVDRGLFSAAHLMKLVGATARKGTHSQERPHRMAHVLDMPPDFQAATREQIAAVAAEFKPTPKPSRAPTTDGFEWPESIEQFAADYLGEFEPGAPKSEGGGVLIPLKFCPFASPQHEGNFKAFVGQMLSGARYAKCQSAGCGGVAVNRWADLCAAVGYEPIRKRAIRAVGGSARIPNQRAAPHKTHAANAIADQAPVTDENLSRLADYDDRSNAEIAASIAVPPQWSDDALALQTVAVANDSFRYVVEWGWLVWDGARWQRDDTLAVEQAARLVCRRAAASALNEIENQRTAAKLARELASNRKVAAVKTLARNDRRVIARANDFDQFPNLLNTPTGIVNLETGELMPHDPKYRLTQITAVGPAPTDADCPLWRKFIADIMRRDGERDEPREQFLQRALGYSIGGLIDEHSWFFCHGLGGNGKGTLQRLMMYLLGDYAAALPSEALVESLNERHPQEWAVLKGKRFVASSEIAKGKRWNLNKIDQVTGDGSITAHYMHGNDFTFKPTLHLWTFANPKPRLPQGGAGVNIERRLHYIEFLSTWLAKPREGDELLPPERRAAVADLEMDAKLQAEGPAILRWLIDGFREWRRQRLNPPQNMQTEMREYLLDQDLAKQWVRDRTEETDNDDLAASAAFDDWKIWAAKQGAIEREIGTLRTFREALEGVGLRRARRKTGAVWVKRRLIEHAEIDGVGGVGKNE